MKETLNKYRLLFFYVKSFMTAIIDCLNSIDLGKVTRAVQS